MSGGGPVAATTVPAVPARHLLFDFGGPILLSPFELIERGAAQLGVDPREVRRGPFDADDVRWRQRVAGEITEREYWAVEAARFDRDVPGFMRCFYEPSGDHLTRPESVALIGEVQASGRRAGVLTNDLTAFHGPEWQDPITVLKVVDPLVDLSHSGHLKPDPEAYRVGIEAMGEAPGDIVYVDDQVDNAAAAERAGLVSVFFDVTDPAASHDRIRAALRG